MKILVQFSQKQEILDFSVQELKALFSVYTADFQKLFKYEIDKNPQIANLQYHQINKDYFADFPFLYVNFDNFNALKQIGNQSILLKRLILTFGEGTTYPELIQNIDYDTFNQYSQSNESFAFVVDSHLKQLTKEEQIEKIQKLVKLNFKGKVDLINYRHRYCIIEDWYNNNIGDTCLKKIYFGLELFQNPKQFNKYALNNRLYLGPTSTDHELSLLMVNQAKIQQYDFVWDPFVGTGSILIAAAAHGAFCYGTEIDARVLHGYGNKTIKPNIWVNFQQYGLPRPEIIRFDSKTNKFRQCQLFDAIICDPPYGIRAGARVAGRKTKTNEEDKLIKSEENKETNELQQDPEETKSEQSPKIKGDDYYQPTMTTSCLQMVEGLFQLSLGMLKKGGRLVFLYPIVTETGNYTLDDLPQHKSFKLIDYSENPLSAIFKRILITMEKIE